MDKRFWAIVAVIIAVFVGILWVNGNKKSGNGTTTNSSTPTHHVEGNLDSKVKLLEYGDYQCPYCGLYYPVVNQVLAKYKSQISFQFRNLPLQQLHPNAFAAARAAEAAGLQNQGKFWQMHDLLYQNQQAWEGSKNPESIFEGYAKQLGMNTMTFRKDFASSTVNNLINADRAAFDATGNDLSTPTFLLNGKKVTPQPSLEAFSTLLDAALKK